MKAILFALVLLLIIVAGSSAQQLLPPHPPDPSHDIYLLAKLFYDTPGRSQTRRPTLIPFFIVDSFDIPRLAEKARHRFFYSPPPTDKPPPALYLAAEYGNAPDSLTRDRLLALIYGARRPRPARPHDNWNLLRLPNFPYIESMDFDSALDNALIIYTSPAGLASAHYKKQNGNWILSELASIQTK